MLGFCTQMDSVRDDFCLALEQLVAEQLRLYVFKADALNGVREALALDALVAEQQDCLLHDIQNFLLRGEDLLQRDAVCALLAPASADVYAVAVDGVITCMERALADTASAAGTDLWIDRQLAVDDMCRVDRTGRGRSGSA